jgi:hypothetical protein
MGLRRSGHQATRRVAERAASRRTVPEPPRCLRGRDARPCVRARLTCSTSRHRAREIGFDTRPGGQSSASPCDKRGCAFTHRPRVSVNRLRRRRRCEDPIGESGRSRCEDPTRQRSPGARLCSIEVRARTRHAVRFDERIRAVVYGSDSCRRPPPAESTPTRRRLGTHDRSSRTIRSAARSRFAHTDLPVMAGDPPGSHSLVIGAARCSAPAAPVPTRQDVQCGGVHGASPRIGNEAPYLGNRDRVTSTERAPEGPTTCPLISDRRVAIVVGAPCSRVGIGHRVRYSTLVVDLDVCTVPDQLEVGEPVGVE